MKQEERRSLGQSSRVGPGGLERAEEIDRASAGGDSNTDNVQHRASAHVDTRAFSAMQSLSLMKGSDGEDATAIVILNETHKFNTGWRMQ